MVDFEFVVEHLKVIEMLEKEEDGDGDVGVRRDERKVGGERSSGVGLPPANIQGARCRLR